MDGAAASMDAALSAVVAATPDLDAVLVTDHDGVCIVSSGEASAARLRLAIAFSGASEQVAKLPEYGAPKAITTVTADATLIQADISPLVISLFGSADANAAALRGVLERLRSALEPARAELQRAIDEEEE